VVIAGINVEDRAGSEAQLESVAAEIRAVGGEALHVVADVRDAEQVAEAVRRAVEGFGGLDILCNVVGGMFPIPFLELSEGGLDAVLRVNIKTAFLCSQAAARVMIEQGRGGAITNVASVAAVRPSLTTPHYTAAKAGVIGLTQATALALAPHGIRVNCVAPGGINTPGARRVQGEPEIPLESSPLNRMAEPEEVASVVVFLSSDAASFVNGAVVMADGGSSLTTG
jgi:2-deoxy-D-gluconate 3-dehydrogenase